MLRKIYWGLFVYDLHESVVYNANDVDRSFKRKLIHDVSFLLLFSYILLIFSPLVTISADLIAHTFWEKEHLMTVHRDEGKGHVNTELANSAKQADANKSSAKPKPSSETDVCLLPLLTKSLIYGSYIVQNYPSHKFYCTVRDPDKDFRPPRA